MFLYNILALKYQTSVMSVKPRNWSQCRKPLGSNAGYTGRQTPLGSLMIGYDLTRIICCAIIQISAINQALICLSGLGSCISLESSCITSIEVWWALSLMRHDHRRACRKLAVQVTCQQTNLDCHWLIYIAQWRV